MALVRLGLREPFDSLLTDWVDEEMENILKIEEDGDYFDGTF